MPTLRNGDKLKTLTVRQLSSAQDFRHFLRFPYSLYRNNPYWVPSLISEEKKLFNDRKDVFLRNNPVAFFICKRREQTVGRIAAIINREHLEIHQDGVGFFGFFECINDPHAAELLITAASDWLKERDVTRLRGPTNYTLNNISGLLVDGFEESPTILMPYNFTYYSNLLENLGFERAMNFFAYNINDREIRIPDYFQKLERRIEENNIRIRPINFKDINNESKIVVELFNEAWSGNWGFIPTNLEEVISDFKMVRHFAKPELILIAEHSGKAVGFSLALPDINQALQNLKGRLFPLNWIKLIRNLKKISRIRVALMGITKKYRNRGIDLMLYKRTFDNAVRLKLHEAELSWILENNHMMNRVLNHINARKNKTYSIFEKEL